MANTLFILNDPPCGSERSYTALRPADALSRRAGENAKVFLMGDAAACATAQQKMRPGYDDLETMLKASTWRGDRRLRQLHGRTWHR